MAVVVMVVVVMAGVDWLVSWQQQQRRHDIRPRDEVCFGGDGRWRGPGRRSTDRQRQATGRVGRPIPRLPASQQRPLGAHYSPSQEARRRYLSL